MKNVLITGGSGAVGRSLVHVMRRHGWKTAFTWNTRESEAMTLAHACAATPFRADLTDPEQAKALAREVEERFGPLDALVNAAGMTQIMPFALLDPDDWDLVMAANLKSMYLATHALIRGMIQRKKGSIVNFGSLAGHRLLEVPVSYATAKSGVTGFTLALAREMARYNIRVNEVSPGMLEDGVGRMVPEAEKAEYFKYCLAGRAGKCDEVAEVVEFLCSDRASYINAQTIHVTGGF